MAISRIFQPVPLTLHATIHLDEKASHHLSRVLRARIGDHLTLFNGRGGEYTAVITRMDKKGVDVNISAFSERDVESPVRIHLAQGMARGEKMDFIVQKATELGVDTIIPLMTERSNVRFDSERQEKRMQHWQFVAQSSCEQCGRNRLPHIQSPLSFTEWLPMVKADRCFVLSPKAQNKLPMKTHTHASIVLLIGPEGGLSDPEIDAAIQRGFLPLNLGPRVLRTETAPLTAISILQYCYGDLG